MKKISLALALSIMAFGKAFSQTGYNGPLLTYIFGVVESSPQNAFQKQLETENIQRLRSEGQQAYLEELEASMRVEETEPFSESGDSAQGYLLTQLDQIADELRWSIDVQSLLREGDPYAEELPELSAREAHALTGRIAVLEQQLAQITDQMPESAEDSSLLVQPHEEDLEAIGWLIQVEQGLIR